MAHNLYWSVYQNLEKELIELSNHIHIDDKQLNIYSMKIAELLIRTVVEVESLAKELYLNNSGHKPDDKELYFDTDCLALLKEKWKLDLKKVQVVSSNFYFDKDENRILTPLRKAHKRGDKSERWLRAYQAIKHNRRISLEKASLQNLIQAMAALYILNIYYKDTEFDLGNDAGGNSFDTSCGSMIFSVFLHSSKGINTESLINKQNNFDECIYLVVPTQESALPIQDLMKKINNDVHNEMQQVVTKETVHSKLLEINPNGKTYEDAINEAISRISKDLFQQKMQQKALQFKNLYYQVKFQCLLNKSQF
ncbi:hypothetical protein NYR75_08165 [Actinobacillus equuli subsp. haemolyticus]|uniref:hypothetical protein n=1 Tax=Actinobacillus equuli TaxID=718 RepID=UPI0024411081|nr:hypothetical protein [Actinobacillus equuli]WGE62734.1 hypothetical protein NYR75_08165 [Actinobacillus equuli subsp. haemolyticus]